MDNTFLCVRVYLYVGIGHNFPQVASWFRSLARNAQFSTAVWTASDDRGYEAFNEYIIGPKLTDVKHKTMTEKVSINSSGQKKHKPVSAPVVNTASTVVCSMKL